MMTTSSTRKRTKTEPSLVSLKRYHYKNRHPWFSKVELDWTNGYREWNVANDKQRQSWIVGECKFSTNDEMNDIKQRTTPECIVYMSSKFCVQVLKQYCVSFPPRVLNLIASYNPVFEVKDLHKSFCFLSTHWQEVEDLELVSDILNTEIYPLHKFHAGDGIRHFFNIPATYRDAFHIIGSDYERDLIHFINKSTIPGHPDSCILSLVCCDCERTWDDEMANSNFNDVSNKEQLHCLKWSYGR